MRLTNILKYEDKSLCLASWQRRLHRERASKLTARSQFTVRPFYGGKLRHAAWQTNRGGRRRRKPRLQSKLQLEAIEVVRLSKAVLSWCWSPYFYWWSVVFTDTFGAHNCEFWWLCFVADFHVIHGKPKPLRLCSVLRWSRPLRFKHKRINLKDWLYIYFFYIYFFFKKCHGCHST